MPAEQTRPLTAEEKAKRFADLMVKHGVKFLEPGDMEKAMNQTVQGCRNCGAAPGAFCENPSCPTRTPDKGPSGGACSCDSGKTCRWPNCQQTGAGIGHYP